MTLAFQIHIFFFFNICFSFLSPIISNNYYFMLLNGSQSAWALLYNVNEMTPDIAELTLVVLCGFCRR